MRIEFDTHYEGKKYIFPARFENETIIRCCFLKTQLTKYYHQMHYVGDYLML